MAHYPVGTEVSIQLTGVVQDHYVYDECMSVRTPGGKVNYIHPNDLSTVITKITEPFTPKAGKRYRLDNDRYSSWYCYQDDIDGSLHMISRLGARYTLEGFRDFLETTGFEVTEEI